MRPRFLVVGTLAATLVMFVWQTVSNAALPWYRSQMLRFGDEPTMLAALRASAPHNAIYYSPRGVVAITSIEPGVDDKATLLVPMMERQLLVDVVAVLGLCVLIGRLPEAGVVRTGVTFALAAAVVTLVIEGSNAIWYGFPRRWAEVSVVDQAISFFLAGATLRAIWRKTAPRVEEPRDVGVRAGTGLPLPNETPARMR